MNKIFVLAAVVFTLLPTRAYAAAEGAECACVMNAVTGEVILDKNADQKRAMASTTKIMTALVALENSDMYDIVEFSKNAEIQEGSGMYAGEGQRFYMEDMLYGLMLNSGNDAAMAIAEHIAGGKETFADMMNEKAWHIGAGNTAFCNPSGLDQEGHYTTARDLAQITRYALKNEDFRRIVSARSRTAWPLNGQDPLELYNHNKLLSIYDGCIGVKTGYTTAAGRCLVSAAERDGMTFIAVTLDDNDDWNDHMQMLDEAFASHYLSTVVREGQAFKNVKIGKKTYPLIAGEDFYVPSAYNKGLDIDVVPHIAYDFTEAANAGEKVGYAEIIYNDETIGQVDIVSKYAMDDVMKDIRFRNSFFGKFHEALKYLLFN